MGAVGSIAMCVCHLSNLTDMSCTQKSISLKQFCLTQQFGLA